MIYFSGNLRYLRQVNGLSQEDLALNIGLNRGNIASYEKGNAEPKLENLLKIAKFFNISGNDLIGKDLALKDQLDDHQAIDESIVQLELQAENFQKIIDGFKAFHHYKISRDPEKTGRDPKEVLEDFTKLLDVCEHLLSHHKEVIDSIRSEKV